MDKDKKSREEMEAELRKQKAALDKLAQELAKDRLSLDILIQQTQTKLDEAIAEARAITIRDETKRIEENLRI